MPRFRVWASVLVLALAILAGLHLLAQWMRPPNPIVVATDTTVVTEPLTEHGLPDYVLEKKKREGWDAPHDQNGAVQFWQAVGQGLLEEEHWRLLCLELGIDPASHQSGLAAAGQNVGDRIDAWLGQQRSNQPSLAPILTSPAYYDSSSLAMDAASMPWTADQCPPLAKSLEQHRDHFQLLATAASRPKFYSPTIVSLGLSNEPDIGMNILMALSEMVDPLCQRACLLIADGRLEEAWGEIWTAMRLSHRVPNKNFIGYLISTARFGDACDVLRHLLASPAVSTHLVNRIQHDLATLDDPRQQVLDCLYAERIFSISTLVGIANGEPWGEDVDDALLILWGYDSKLKTLKKGSLDWNLVLRKMNANFDRMKLAASAPKPKGRHKHLDALRRLQSEHVNHVESALSRAAGYLSVSKRSRLFADEEARSSFDAFYSVLDRYDHKLVRLELMKVALANTKFRCDRGGLAQDLNALVPDYLHSLPTDPVYELPLVYDVLSDGFLIYSIGPNNRDDRGCNSDFVFRGVTAYDALESEDPEQIEAFLRRIGEEQSVRKDRIYDSLIPSGADDIPYRVSSPTDSIRPWIEKSLP